MCFKFLIYKRNFRQTTRKHLCGCLNYGGARMKYTLAYIVEEATITITW